MEDKQNPDLGDLIDEMMRLAINNPDIIKNPDLKTPHHQRYHTLKAQLNDREPDYLRDTYDLMNLPLD